MPARSDARLRLLTPGGGRVGGVAVLALEGPDRAERARDLLRSTSGRPFAQLDGSPRLARLVVSGEVVDEALVFDRPDLGRIEIHTHGSPAVLRALGLGAADGTSDLDPARVLVRDALDDAQLALGLEQAALPDWEAFVAELAALPAGPVRRAAVDAARRRSRDALALVTPTTVALCGVQNAGKSSLFNRLLFHERALTGSEAGLTRDPVEDLAVLDGYPYRLVDTAGDGPIAGPLDEAARVVGRARREAAAFRILVIDLTRWDDPEQIEALRESWRPGSSIAFCNKFDLRPDLEGVRFDPGSGAIPGVFGSCVREADGVDLRLRVGEALRSLRELPAAGPVGGPAALTPEDLARLDEIDVGDGSC